MKMWTLRRNTPWLLCRCPDWALVHIKQVQQAQWTFSSPSPCKGHQPTQAPTGTVGMTQAGRWPIRRKRLRRTRKNSGVSGPDRSVKCADMSYVPYNRSWCTVELCLLDLCGIMWSIDLSPSTQGICLPPQSGHWGFSLLAASKKDEPG
jgi:hypothetical protein